MNVRGEAPLRVVEGLQMLVRPLEGAVLAELREADLLERRGSRQRDQRAREGLFHVVEGTAKDSGDAA
jgi:hypothetical protein